MKLSINKFTKLLAKSFLVLACLTTSNFVIAQLESSVPAETNVRGAEYPRILPDHSVVFQIRAPQAKQVQIDLHKVYDMTKNVEGIWTVTTEPQGPGFHYYSLIIDGVTVADPASETFYGMSRMASGIEIPYEDGDYYQLKDVPHGDIRSKRFYSKTTQSWRRVNIYCPPGYDKNTNEKYPVLYIQHGGGEDERGWAIQGKTDIILDNLIAEGKAVPMLVVMSDGNVAPAEPGNYNVNFEPFEEELLENVIPFIEANYRVKTGGANRALAGLSMGGLQTLYVGIPHTDKFNYLGIFSSGWIIPGQQDLSDKYFQYMKENADEMKKNLKLIFMTMGDKEDIAYNNGVKLRNNLMHLGLNILIMIFREVIPGRYGVTIFTEWLHCYSNN